MEDPQFPPEAADAEGAPPARRSALRLSDAEVVATTRLDMLGDGSLKEALAGPARELEGGPDSPSAAPAANPPDAAAHNDQPALERTPDTELLLPLPAFRHRFGAATDPAPGERPAREPDHPDPNTATAPPPLASLPQEPNAPIDPGPAGQAVHDLEHPRSDATAVPQLSPPSPDQSSDPEPAQSPAAAHMEVSPVLSALDTAEERAEEVTEPREQPAAPVMFGPPIMMPPGLPDGSADAGPLNQQPRFRDELIKGPPGSGTAGDAEPPATTIASVQDPAAQPAPDFAEAPSFPETPGGPEFAEAETAFLEPREVAAFPEPPPETMLSDAAAKIAAEANATAEALENLKRLLGHTLPHIERSEPASQDPREFLAAPSLGSPPLQMRLDPLQMRVDPLQFAASAPAPLLPLPVPPARSGSRGVYLLGFLTGLGLSLMAGAALYFFIFVISSTG